MSYYHAKCGRAELLSRYLALAEFFEVHQAGAGRNRHKLSLPASVGLPAAYEFTDRSSFKANFGDQTVRVLGDEDGAGVA